MTNVVRVPLIGERMLLTNFTHYDTGDLARLIEGIHAYRRHADRFPLREDAMLHVRELSLSYTRKNTGKYVHKAGREYLMNGLRIRKPDKLFENPVEALAQGRVDRLPTGVVLELIRLVSQGCFGQINHQGVAETLAVTFPVRINDKVAQRRPSGFYDRGYATRKSQWLARGAFYRVRSGSMALMCAAKRLKKLQKFTAALAITTPELTQMIEECLALEQATHAVQRKLDQFDDYIQAQTEALNGKH